MINKKNLLILAGGAVLVGFLTTAATYPGQPQYKFGGTFIGKGAGTVWTALQIPKSADGLTAALRVNYTSFGADIAALGAAFGGETWSDFVGEAVMINRDTMKWTLVGYAQAPGPQKEQMIKGIAVVFGTMQYSDADHAVLHYTTTMYPAAADADHDGVPDPGATPAVTIPDITDTAQRVPIFQ
jgi:hypothetical protein